MIVGEQGPPGSDANVPEWIKSSPTLSAVALGIVPNNWDGSTLVDQNGVYTKNVLAEKVIGGRIASSHLATDIAIVNTDLYVGPSSTYGQLILNNGVKIKSRDAINIGYTLEFDASDILAPPIYMQDGSSDYERVATRKWVQENASSVAKFG